MYSYPTVNLRLCKRKTLSLQARLFTKKNGCFYMIYAEIHLWDICFYTEKCQNPTVKSIRITRWNCVSAKQTTRFRWWVHVGTLQITCGAPRTSDSPGKARAIQSIWGNYKVCVKQVVAYKRCSVDLDSLMSWRLTSHWNILVYSNSLTSQ